MAREVEGIIRDLGAVPGDHRRPRRASADRTRRRRPRAARQPPRRHQGQPPRPALRHGARRSTARRRSPRRCGWRRWPGSGSSSPAASAGCTAAPSRPSTSAPTSPSCPPPTSPSCRPGVKSILDIGLTLETLETLGVPVLTVGADEFPSFYSRSSGHAVADARRHRRRGRRVMRHKWDLGLAGGLVVANPIPEADEIPADADRRDHRPGARRHGRARDPRQGRDAVPPRHGSSRSPAARAWPPTSRWCATTRGSAPRSPRRTPAG